MFKTKEFSSYLESSIFLEELLNKNIQFSVNYLQSYNKNGSKIVIKYKEMEPEIS